jgi:hypothetical protein
MTYHRIIGKNNKTGVTNGVEQELLIILEHLSSLLVFVGFVLFNIYLSVAYCIPLCVILSLLLVIPFSFLRFTASGIFLYNAYVNEDDTMQYIILFSYMKLDLFMTRHLSFCMIVSTKWFRL